MGKSYDGDYEFGQACQFDKRFRKVADRVQTAELKPVAEAYDRNMERVVSLNIFPVEAVHWAIVASRASAIARLACGFAVDDLSQSENPAVLDVYSAQMDAHTTRWLSMETDDCANEAWSLGTIFLKTIVRAFRESGTGFESGLESALYAMVLNSYAAFESLASDLWLKAVDLNPRLAKNVIENKKFSNAGDEEEKQDQKSKMVDWNILSDRDFDIASSMGQILRKSKKVDFQSLRGVRHAYMAAFREPSDVYATLFPNDALERIEKTRHLLAHRAGLMDQQFVWAMRSLKVEGDFETGKYLTLCGPDVRDLVGPCVSTAVDLILSVDSWMVQNAHKRDETL